MERPNLGPGAGPERRRCGPRQQPTRRWGGIHGRSCSFGRRCVGRRRWPVAAHRALGWNHLGGRAWPITPVADIDARYTTVADLLALSPTDAWAVGQMWDHALVLHWDGDQWAQVASPRDRATRLSALAAVASDDLWAVGTTFADVDGNGPTQGIIEHWDRRAWNLVTLPALTPGTALASVSALGRDDVWVAGNTTRSDGSAYSRLLLHYDGSQWTMVDRKS